MVGDSTALDGTTDWRTDFVTESASLKHIQSSQQTRTMKQIQSSQQTWTMKHIQSSQQTWTMPTVNCCLRSLSSYNSLDLQYDNCITQTSRLKPKNHKYDTGLRVDTPSSCTTLEHWTNMAQRSHIHTPLTACIMYLTCKEHAGMEKSHISSYLGPSVTWKNLQTHFNWQFKKS